jgi:ribose 1,5-bisphosphokinase
LLVAVVGPSGAGKDTLMGFVAAAMATDDVSCVRRCITRPSEAGGEAHEALNADEFAAREAAGAFALSWRAHDLAYAIPRAAIAEVEEGAIRLANLSRGVVPRAAGLGVPVLVLEITASPETLAARLSGRGRESATDIAKRLAREAPLDTAGLPYVRVANDTTPAHAGDAMIGAIRAALSARADAATGS